MGEEFKHKNILQEYAQKSSIHLPLYQTMNEGSDHAPQFRSTVTVDGNVFKSPYTFPNKKAAEQYVAKYALESIACNIKQQGLLIIHNGTIFCKSVLHEYAVKMNMKMPTYNTSQEPAVTPVFISSVSFDNKIFTGAVAKSKKEAEQNGARSVIEFILGNSDTRITMMQIIKSKDRFYATMGKVDGSNSSQNRSAVMIGPIMPKASVEGKEVWATKNCDMSHDASPKSFSLDTLANNTAAQSVPLEACKQSAGLIRKESSLPTPGEIVTTGTSNVEGKEVWVAVSCDMSHDVASAKSFSLNALANTAADNSIPPEACKQNPGLITKESFLPSVGETVTTSASDRNGSSLPSLGETVTTGGSDRNEIPLPTLGESILTGTSTRNESSLPTLGEAVTIGASTSGVSKSDINEPHVQHLAEVKTEVQDDLGNQSTHSEGEVPIAKRKPPRKKSKEDPQLKKTRADETSEPPLAQPAPPAPPPDNLVINA
ncbi:hypothetical protein Cni_G14725 [Canna indica]|uniref:DRBM domain-containing protein n=1 Tax=Canna indica TaxID=4628 RepID=A0AAQ3KFN1_9LILI|nr:hypothetical protein Cni_G14725 [Canna indica]